MSILSRAAAALALCCMAAAARGDGLSSSVTPQPGGGIGFTFDGGISGRLKASGPPPAGCTNQLVLDYSNSCALIGQGWGE